MPNVNYDSIPKIAPFHLQPKYSWQFFVFILSFCFIAEHAPSKNHLFWFIIQAKRMMSTLLYRNYGNYRVYFLGKRCAISVKQFNIVFESVQNTLPNDCLKFTRNNVYIFSCTCFFLCEISNAIWCFISSLGLGGIFLLLSVHYSDSFAPNDFHSN